MKISVVIATLKGEFLEEALKSLYQSLEGLTNEVIVINNSSKELNISNAHLNRVIIVKNSMNLGFAGAINQGALLAKGKYLLILNDDCLVEKDTVKKMVDYLDSNLDLVATQPVVLKMKNEKGKIKNENVENIGYIVDTWVGRAKVITDPNFQFSNFKLQLDRHIYGLSATCLLIRREVFEAVQMFDSSFHSYLEDVDLFVRLNKKGYKYRPILDATCFHYHMATSTSMGNYKQKQDSKNWLRIILKNFSPQFIIAHLPSLLIERLRNLNGVIKVSLR